jgi:hypothetical protein
LDRFGFAMLRLGLVVVLCFLGGLKTANAIPAAAQTTTAPAPTGSAELEQMSDLQPFTHIAYVPANADLSTIRIDTVKMVKVATKLRSMSNTRDCDDWPGNTADCIRTRYESRVPA